MKIGWSRNEYSMNVPCNMNGQMYMRVCRGILDPLYITALAVEGEDLAIFVSIDIVSIPEELSKGITAKVRETHPEIPADCLIYNSTHTHAGPQMFDGNEKTPDGFEVYPPAKSRAHAIEVGAKTVIEAYLNRKEGAMAYGYGYAVVAHSRRVIYYEDMGAGGNPASAAPNGHGVMYGNTRRPEFECYEAGADHFVNLMFTFDEAEKLTGMIINVPCPSQTSEHFTMLTADYWCDVRKAVAEEFGPDVFVLPQCAAAGDLSPRILHYKEAQVRRMGLKYDMHYSLGKTVHEDPESDRTKALSERKDIAERILFAVKEVYAWAKKDIQKDVPVRHIREDVPVRRRIVTDADAEQCRKSIEYLEANLPDPATMTQQEYRVKMSSFNAYINRNKRGLERYRLCKEEPRVETTVHVVRIGDIAFATNRFELYMDYMHQIQARSPFIQTFIVQLCGEGASGYLPTERGVENKGYSASIFCNSVGPEGGRDLVEETLNMLEKVSK
ncbi:MAG: hypothetical protein J5794_06470 [Lachnospiraceae bacterium]|nr:hypothetical protein [Lachnospiraceae bacterium]